VKLLDEFCYGIRKTFFDKKFEKTYSHLFYNNKRV